MHSHKKECTEIHFHAKKRGVGHFSNLVSNPENGECPEKNYQLAKFTSTSSLYSAQSASIARAFDDLKTKTGNKESFIKILKALQPEKKEWSPERECYWFIGSVPIEGIVFKLLQGVIPKSGTRMTKRQKRRWDAFCTLTGCSVSAIEVEALTKNTVQMTVEQKGDLMTRCQLLKFESGEMKNMLLETRGLELIEAPSRGNGRPRDLWSRGPGGGFNLCGKCLMKVRDILWELSLLKCTSMRFHGLTAMELVNNSVVVALLVS
jgi:predicted NAD-dependent protein-ADP-ribosyltransferase YbiA (DUF1768 family)